MIKLIGEIIKSHRISKNLTLRQLAISCDVSVSYLSDIENGICNNPSFKIIKRIANGLGIPVSLLLEDSKPEKAV